MNEVWFPYGEMLLSDYVKKYAEDVPHKVAINYYGKKITYKELHELSDRLAASLHGLGYRKGDCLAAFVQSCPLSIILYLAAMKIGLVLVPIDPMSREFELDYFLEDSGAKVIATMDTLYPLVKGLKAKSVIKDVITLSFRDLLPEEPSLPLHKIMQGEKQTFPEALDCLGLIESGGDRPLRIEVGLKDRGYILYTGGTTGWPKGCIHTQRDVLYCGFGQGKFNFNNAEMKDVMFSPWPITHISGITLSYAVPLLLGMTVVLLARWDAKAAMEAIAKYQVTLAAMATPSYHDLLSHPDVKNYHFGSLRVCLVVAFAIPITDDLIWGWRELTGCALDDWGYSSSEHMNYAGSGYGIRFAQRPACTSFARPMPGVQFKIMDFDTGKELLDGEEGEIVTQSPAQLNEYWNKPEVNQTDIVDGWLHTHDRGYIKDGILFFIGKASEVVKVSGYTVSLREIEVFGKRHPAIDRIAVIAVPHPRKGNELKAFVTLRKGIQATAAQIEEWFKEKVAVFKSPIVEIREELPLSGKGEILKRVLIKEENDKLSGR